MTESDEERRARLDRLRRANKQFMGLVPHNEALGIRILEFDEARARMRLPYVPHLAGNPETGVLHGGVVTALLDACCGGAVFMALREPVPIATLDLRVDHLRAAPAGCDLEAVAHCFRVARHVAFVRATAYVEDESRPIAVAAATFALATPSTPGSSRTQSP
ncbi:MAG: PaaI family thioesterase [Myxococcota bacterium]|nr:PaaI family thioesterase [Myxococcota bacterium]